MTDEQVLEELLEDFHRASLNYDPYNHPQVSARVCTDWDCKRYREAVDSVVAKAWKYEDWISD